MNVINCQDLNPEVIQTTIISQLVYKFQTIKLKGILTTWYQTLEDSINQILSLL